jgi:hypothetical protein
MFGARSKAARAHRASRVEVLRGLHQFIGVTPRPDDAVGLDVVNPSEKRDGVIAHDVIERLRERYTDSIRELAALVGPEFAEWGDL